MRLGILFPLLLTGCLGPPNLIKDGGFEGEPPGLGASASYHQGQAIGPWHVVAEPGFSPSQDADVTTMGTEYPFQGHIISAQSGNVSLDLTGSTNQHVGVAQTVTTTPGRAYVLDFWVGNVNDPGNRVGPTATVDAYINTHLLTRATAVSRPAAAQVWTEATAIFVATTSTTTITLTNGNLEYWQDDGQCGLDSVSVRPVLGM